MAKADVSVFSRVWAVLIGQHCLCLVTAELSAVKNTGIYQFSKLSWKYSGDQVMISKISTHHSQQPALTFLSFHVILTREKMLIFDFFYFCTQTLCVLSIVCFWSCHFSVLCLCKSRMYYGFNIFLALISHFQHETFSVEECPGKFLSYLLLLFWFYWTIPTWLV